MQTEAKLYSKREGPTRKGHSVCEQLILILARISEIPKFYFTASLAVIVSYFHRKAQARAFKVLADDAEFKVMSKETESSCTVGEDVVKFLERYVY